MRRLLLSTLPALLAFGAASPALGASQIGATFDPGDMTNCSGQTFIQTSSPANQYAVPSNGVITSWSFQADPVAPPLRLKVARAAGGADYTIVGQSELETPTPSAVSSFQTRISVASGDIIGFFAVTNAPCALSGVPATYGLRVAIGDLPPGTTTAFSFEVTGQQLDVAATLEPDADNDGFGDETQDLCPTDASKQNECVAPETQITKGPKAKTKKKQATFEFSGTDARAVAGLQCSLDGGAFAACASPHTVKVKKGKHTFSVRATDQAGNTDGTPATDDWKVKKKKKR